MSKTMELAKNFDGKKVSWPAMAQIKYDGVPICYRNIGGHIVALTRQSEPVHSVEHIKQHLANVLEPGDWLIAEHMVYGVQEFKTASGIIRRKETNRNIFGAIFDGVRGGDTTEKYSERMKYLAGKADHKNLFSVRSRVVSSEEEFLAMGESMQYEYKKNGHLLEGLMLHNPEKDFKPGRRGWGMQRWKPQPTIDLEVVGYEEAISQTGSPLGMVGRVNVLLRRQGRPPAVVGIGPGKLTHAERETLWRAYMLAPEHLAGIGSIAEVKYMPDPSYDALRQPTFQRWRTDKTEGDILEY